MKRSFFIILFCFISTLSFSQKLTNSREISYYTYIYKLSEDEARKMLTKKYRFDERKIITQNYLHTKIDSFHTDTVYKKELPQGYYLKVHTEQN